MKKAGKIVIGLVCVGAFGVLMFTRFTKKEEPIEAVPNPTVVVQTPETGNIELSTGLTGTVEPAEQGYIIPKGSGEVLEEGALRERGYFRSGLRAGGKRSVHGEAPV